MRDLLPGTCELIRELLQRLRRRSSDFSFGRLFLRFKTTAVHEGLFHYRSFTREAKDVEWLRTRAGKDQTMA